MTRRRASFVAVLTGFCLASVIGSGTVKADSPAGAQGQPAPLSWTAATPDEMIDLAIARAQKGGDDALAGLVTASFLDERGSFGKARAGLDGIANSSSPLADDARWLSARLKPDPKPAAWPGARVFSYDVPANATGLVTGLAVLGPFQDTGGGGLDKKEGPEAPGESFSDMGARYSWGVYEVAWRRAIPQGVTARGLPLDLYIYPRTESCTYTASKVSFPASTKKVLLFGAASGTMRLIWDGKTISKSEDVHSKLVLDRLAAEIDVTPGPHLVAAKVCTSAVSDEGRVRLRFTDESRRPISVISSSDLKGLVLPPNEDPKKAEPVDPKAKGAPAKGAPAKGGAAGGGAKGGAKPGPVAKPADPKGAPKLNFAGGGKPVDKPTVTPPKGGKGTPLKGGAPAKGAPAKGGKGAPAADVKVEAPLPVARPIETSLEKALKIGDSPTTPQVLQSAVIRVLGGADNAASPRAPGLLDKVTTGGWISVDTLAMAGWIATSGANKSGWLNLAVARGLVEGQKAPLAFAQRRLAAGHISGSSPEWGLTSIEAEPFKSATDPEARLIRSMAKRRLGGAGLSKIALEEMQALATELGDKASIALWDEISSASYTQPEVRLAAVKKLAEMRADSRGPTYIRAFRSLGGAALEAAAAESMVRLTHAADVANMGRELYDTGRYAWARELYYMATQLGPNRASAFVGLAEARRALIALDPKAKDADVERAKADQALLRARDLDPGDPSVKAELGLRSGNTKEAVAGREKMRDEDYLPKPEDFLARARKNPAKKGEMFDRQLHWVRVVTYHPDKRISQLMHYAREIVIEPRTDNDLYEPSIPSEGDTELLFARLYRKDGTIAQPEEQASGGRPFVRWPEMHTGDIVEVAVRSWTDGPVGRRGDAPFYFIDYVGSTDTHPILYNEVVVDSAEGSRLAIDVLNGKVEKYDEQKKDGRVIQRYIWENPPIVAEEPLAPRLSEVLPVVVGSTFAGWGEFREWYRGAVKGFTEPDEQTRRLAADLTKGKKTRDEKIRALFDFVADDIRYVNYVSGEWWLPNRPQELLARRQGDCDDKAMLLITLLKSVGISATEVLVQTRYTAEPSLLRSTKAAIPVFDHGIAFLPGEKGKPGMWLDATSPESRLGPLPSMDSRAVAMFVDEGDAKIIDTPSASTDDHGIDAEWSIKLSSTGAGELTASERHSGDAAFEARMNLKQADARQQWVEQYLSNGFFPTVQVKPEIDFKADLPNGVVTLKYSAESDGFARREGDELAVPLSETTTLTGQLAALSKRTLPVALPPNLAPGHQTRAITITAPAGYAFAELPPGGEENGGEFGKAKITFAKGKTKDSVIVTRSVAFDMSVVPVDKYEKWRAWLQRTDRLMHQMVRLIPTGEPKKADVAKPDVTKPDLTKPGLKVDPATVKKAIETKVAPKGATKGSKK